MLLKNIRKEITIKKSVILAQKEQIIKIVNEKSYHNIIKLNTIFHKINKSKIKDTGNPKRLKNVKVNLPPSLTVNLTSKEIKTKYN